MKSSIAITSLLSIPLVSAWGNLGHQTIGYIAQDFLSSATKTWAQTILGDKSSNLLAGQATWADTYKYTSAGAFSREFHYIDANDSPPNTCNVDYNRDCPEDNCVVSAIVNYTSLVGDTSQSKTMRNQSLMFLVHFLGDIHQPLHDEALEVGGNDIDVKYAGASTNLHHIWDTNMPEQYAGGYSLAKARTWATTLTNEIKTGSYKSQAASWIDGMSLGSSQDTALSWASDSNAYVCSTVFSESQAELESDNDLAGNYYDQSLPIIQIQFAKAGYRLASWLNLIATGQTS